MVSIEKVLCRITTGHGLGHDDLPLGLHRLCLDRLCLGVYGLRLRHFAGC